MAEARASAQLRGGTNKKEGWQCQQPPGATSPEMIRFLLFPRITQRERKEKGTPRCHCFYNLGTRDEKREDQGDGIGEGKVATGKQNDRAILKDALGRSKKLKGTCAKPIQKNI